MTNKRKYTLNNNINFKAYKVKFTMKMKNLAKSLHEAADFNRFPSTLIFNFFKSSSIFFNKSFPLSPLPFNTRQASQTSTPMPVSQIWNIRVFFLSSFLLCWQYIQSAFTKSLEQNKNIKKNTISNIYLCIIGIIMKNPNNIETHLKHMNIIS